MGAARKVELLEGPAEACIDVSFLLIPHLVSVAGKLMLVHSMGEGPRLERLLWHRHYTVVSQRVVQLGNLMEDVGLCTGPCE
jgi:hypothetical protein